MFVVSDLKDQCVGFRAIWQRFNIIFININIIYQVYDQLKLRNMYSLFGRGEGGVVQLGAI